MNKRIAITIITFSIGILLLSVGVITDVYIELPWNIQGSWTSNSNLNPQFEIIHSDPDRGTIIRLYGDKEKKFNFLLENRQEPYLLAGDEYSNYPYIVFSLKTEERTGFQINVNLEITIGIYNGDRLIKEVPKIVSLQYEPVDYNNGFRYADKKRDIIYIGLGKETMDGQWYSICRNVKEDFERAYHIISDSKDEDARVREIFGVKSVEFKGDLYLNDMSFYKDIPVGVEIKNPKTLVWASENTYVTYKDGYRRPAQTTYTYYNEIGEVSRKIVNDYTHRADTKPILWIATNLNSKNELVSKSENYYFYDSKTDYLSWMYDNTGKLKSIGYYIYSPSSSLGIKLDEDGNPLYMDAIKYGTPSEKTYYQFTSENAPKIDELLQKWDEAKISNKQNEDEETKSRDGKIKLDDFVAFKNSIINDDSGAPRLDVLNKSETKKDLTPEGKIDKLVTTSFDGNNNISSTENTYYNPETQDKVWSDKEFYNESGKVSGKTRERVLFEETRGAERLAVLACDYDSSNELQDVKVNYFKYDEKNNLEERWINVLNPKLDKKDFIKEKFQPFNMNSIVLKDLAQVVEKKRLKQDKIEFKNLVLDGDMITFQDYRPAWKPEGNIKCNKVSDGLRIEHLKDNSNEKVPGYSVQFMPIKGGSYQLSVKYRREWGTAHIKIDWVSLEDVWDTKPLDELSINLIDYEDDHNVGYQTEKILFTAPNEPGLLVLKIGAASAVVYSNVEITAYEEPAPVAVLPQTESAGISFDAGLAGEAGGISDAASGNSTVSSAITEMNYQNTSPAAAQGTGGNVNKIPVYGAPVTGRGIVEAEEDVEEKINDENNLETSPLRGVRTTKRTNTKEPAVKDIGVSKQTVNEIALDKDSNLVQESFGDLFAELASELLTGQMPAKEVNAPIFYNANAEKYLAPQTGYKDGINKGIAFTIFKIMINIENYFYKQFVKIKSILTALAEVDIGKK